MHSSLGAKAPLVFPGSREASCESPDPLGVLSEEHALQLELCDILEALADSLPHEFDRRLASVAVAVLEQNLPAHTRLEEDGLFPLLRLRAGDLPALLPALARLEEEHERDADLLEELLAALKAVIATGRAENPNMLGYMLRGFFESQRRHIGWEDSVVLPVAREVLTMADLAALQDWIMRSGDPRCCRRSLVDLLGATPACGTCSSFSGNGKSGPSRQ